MTSQEIIEAAEIGSKFSVLNSPFLIKGTLTLTLEGGEELYWVFGDDDRQLSIHTGTDEVIVFTPIGGETTGDEEAIVHLGKEYEFSYDDQGNITDFAGEVDYDLDEQVRLRDYESEEGEIVRHIASGQTGDQSYLLGTNALEDDVFLIQ